MAIFEYVNVLAHQEFVLRDGSLLVQLSVLEVFNLLLSVVELQWSIFKNNDVLTRILFFFVGLKTRFFRNQAKGLSGN